MTTNASFDDRLAAWLEQDSAHRVPEHLDEVLVLTRPMPQRKWWSSPERWLPMDVTARAGSLAPPRIGRLVLVGLSSSSRSLALLRDRFGAKRVPPPFGPADNGVILRWTHGCGDSSRPIPTARTPARSSATRPSTLALVLARRHQVRLLARGTETESELVMVANADGSGVRPLNGAPLIDADWFEWSPRTIASHRPRVEPPAGA